MRIPMLILNMIRLMGVKNTALLAISTPQDELNYYSG